jgi:hypothetical protein
MAYGVADGAWKDEEDMFTMVHTMRSRIVTAPCFTGDRYDSTPPPSSLTPPPSINTHTRTQCVSTALFCGALFWIRYQIPEVEQT